MQTIILDKPGHLIRTDTTPPGAPGPGEVRLRVHHVGICGTDLHAFQGRQPFFNYPRILGHELSVEVLETGDGVSHIHTGDHCTVLPYLHCGHCIACRRGKTNCCTSLQVLGVHTDGGMREEIVLPADKLLPSKTLSLEQLALVETLSIGAHAVDRAQLEPEEWVLVIGAGPIGLGIIQMARIAGARILLMELSQPRIEFCRSHFPIETVIDHPDETLDRLRACCPGELPTAVFDATGNQRSMMNAFQYVANGGRLILVGITLENITFSGVESHRREMTLLNSRNARASDLMHVMRHMESGDIDIHPWITHRADIAGILEQFPAWLDPENGVIKAVLAL